jgi:hypothetical protein
MENQEVETVVAEVEAAPIENNNPIADLLKSIEGEDFNTAETQFNDLIGDRLQDTLDQAKVRIASSIYNGEEPEQEESEEDLDIDAELEVEIEDEDLENAE